MGKKFYSGDDVALLNWARWRLRLKSDRELANVLGMPPPVISKIRHGHRQIGAVVLAEILEVTDARLQELPDLIAQTPQEWRVR